MPITVSGASLNVPAAAIRFPAQRRAGAQPRLELAFEWPQLTPPRTGRTNSAQPEARPPERIFLSIGGAEGALPLLQRVRTIYSRYVAIPVFAGPAGLSAISFRDGTPYQGEDLLFDPARPQRFLVRCTRASGSTPGTCLLERPLGPAQLAARFPREWLAEWPRLDAGIERLGASLQPGA